MNSLLESVKMYTRESFKEFKLKIPKSPPTITSKTRVGNASFIHWKLFCLSLYSSPSLHFSTLLPFVILKVYHLLFHGKFSSQFHFFFRKFTLILIHACVYLYVSWKGKFELWCACNQTGQHGFLPIMTYSFEVEQLSILLYFAFFFKYSTIFFFSR